MISVVLIDTTLEVGITGTQDGTGAFLNSGVWTWTLLTLRGTPLASGQVDYVAASDGNYNQVIDTSGLLAKGQTYLLRLAFNDGHRKRSYEYKVLAGYSQ